jgi:D-lactate dehydrogenase
MKIAFFDTHRFDKDSFSAANAAFNFEIDFLEPRLTETTASLAKGHDVVCAFANDSLNRKTLEVLKSEGIKLIALRCAGYNCVDLEAAKELSLPIVRVPAYSPHAVAEHAVALLLTVTRQVHRAHARVREGNFSLDGLVGTELHGKKVGVLGTGKIGSIFAQIMTGFGCEVLAFDLKPNPELLAQKKTSYTTLDEIFKVCDIISLHLPLNPTTRHLIDANAISKMKKGVILLNTGRGGLIDTKALITALKKGQIGSAGLDVYEEEEEIFFRDHSSEVLQDDVLARLMTFPNVLITAHQAFLTDTALRCIAETTLQNISDFKNGLTLKNQIL